MSAWTRLWSGSRRLRADQSQTGALAGPLGREAAGTSGNPAKILFINQYYWPDNASTAQHLTDLAESLANRGYECHVLCCKGGYQGNRAHVPADEVHNGVHIHRVGSTALGRRSFARRMADYLSFYARALSRAITLPRCDVSITLTTPPIIGLIGVILGRLKGTKHVFWSMDLHPDAGIALGIMPRKNPVIAALAWLSDAVHRAADRVVVLGPYMADRIAAKHVRPGRIETIHVWSRRDEIYPMPRQGHPLRESLGLGDKFVAMYSGNMGLAHAFDDFLEAARRLKDRDDMVFLFVGDGPRKKEVLAAKEAHGLDNVRLLDYFPREQLHASLSLADVHLMSMRREMTGIVVPCKLYGAMASSRPALFVGPEHCETADTIRESGCGHTIRLGETDAVVEALELLAADPEAAARMGRSGREAFLSDFEREGCCDRWGWMIGELLGTPAVRPLPVPRPALSAGRLVVPTPSRMRKAS
ncbi:MAG: glycosyltransferase [Planctomycetota bacterium]|nr:glycosyltransferase [Planctomycetota bacterium]